MHAITLLESSLYFISSASFTGLTKARLGRLLLIIHTQMYTQRWFEHLCHLVLVTAVSCVIEFCFLPCLLHLSSICLQLRLIAICPPSFSVSFKNKISLWLLACVYVHVFFSFRVNVVMGWWCWAASSAPLFCVQNLISLYKLCYEVEDGRL